MLGAVVLGTLSWLAGARAQASPHWDPDHRDRKTASSSGRGGTPWGYHDPNGWGASYPECRGQRQSPINFCAPESLVKAAPPFPELNLVDYELPRSNLNLLNNGHTVKIDLEDALNFPAYLSGGGLNGTRYRLKQFHLHWAKPGRGGSEHMVNGRRFAGELHLVHLKDGVPDMAAATRGADVDNIAVLAVFLELDIDLDHETSALAPISHCAEKANWKGSQCRLEPITLDSLLPKDRSNFWTYYGSLTTPPCTQTVVWTVMTQPLPVSGQTLQHLDALHDDTQEEHNQRVLRGDEILFNDRPPQPTHGRPIFLRRPLDDLGDVCNPLLGSGAAFLSPFSTSAFIGFPLLFRAVFSHLL